MALRRVAGGLLALPRLLPVLWRRTPLGQMQREFYAVVYGLAGGRARFMNFGHAPVDPSMPVLPELAAEPFQASLYFEVLREGAAALGRAPALLAEAACGRGGGLRLAASLFPGARLAGFDLQPAALAVARFMLADAAPGRAGFAAADGLRLPLPDGSVEMLVSVEAMMNLGRPSFMAEAARVLAPGGVLATSGSMLKTPAEAQAILAQDSAARGLELVVFRDLSPGVVAACRADAPRRARLTWIAPWPLRARFRDFAALPGTPTFEAYASGARTYYLAVMRRAGAAIPA